jgi:pimeloyl-ACP methyl ester carboxylesterase
MTATAISECAVAMDDTGTGGPALLMFPGWCGDRTVFDGLRERLSANRRVIAVDLPAHGGSDDPGVDVTSAFVTETIEHVAQAAGLDQVVPVSLSHAGWFAIELRRRMGAERVPGLVLLDWMVLGTPPGFTEALAGLQSEPTWRQVRAGLFERWTTGIEVPALHAYVAAMGEYGFDLWSRAGREIAASFAASPVPLDVLAAMDEPCPTVHLYAQPPDDAVLEAQREYARAHPWVQVSRLDARSHFPMFEVPDEMAGQIETFVAGLPGGR